MIVFNLISLLFIFSNSYYIYNYKRLDEPIRVRDYNKKLDLVYYSLKPLFIIWLLFGIFLQVSNIYLALSFLIILRFPLYYTNKSLYSHYHRIVPVINIILLSLLLFNL
jgi:hypothetical protein